MITRLFEILSQGLLLTGPLALTASFLWGVLSILLSPCHLASIPLIVGFISRQGGITVKRAFRLSFLFAFGILLSIALIGVVTGFLGLMLGNLGSWSSYLVAVIFFWVGLYLLEILPFPLLESKAALNFKTPGYLGAFLLGLVFGIALGPCTFAYMAPVLAVCFKVSAGQFFYGVLLLLSYGIGHCSVIVCAGTFTQMLEQYLKWNEKTKAGIILKKICGVLIILAGIYLIWTAR